VLRHLQEALDTVRKKEYARLTGPGPGRTHQTPPELLAAA
jgi:hypothetical protein